MFDRVNGHNSTICIKNVQIALIVRFLCIGMKMSVNILAEKDPIDPVYYLEPYLLLRSKSAKELEMKPTTRSTSSCPVDCMPLLSQSTAIPKHSHL